MEIAGLLFPKSAEMANGRELVGRRGFTEKMLARPKGFEPLTSAFGGQSRGFAPVCSKQIEVAKSSVKPLFSLDHHCPCLQRLV
jgi:hypothetical protein